MDSLNFKVNGQSAKWEYDSEHIDICKLTLNEPLKSFDTVKITTPFFVKIPDAKFSRLGHTGQAYFITQWYPKPAVFDQQGWHPMPYLDQGEFFSEFGSFDVLITLPKNYLLAATGDRIDSDAEDDFLNENVAKTLNHMDNNTRKENGMSFPPSSKEKKTIRFKQFRVHDFAWFADKRFYVLHDQIELPNTKKTIDTWAFFTDKNFKLWKESITYLNESTLFYSYLNGDYPYNHVTAVDGTIMAGGGMEYPNITVIGDVTNAFELDITIAHEVGHNWYYGILGNNERDNPALDEGINSLYELRYTRAKYGTKKLSDYIGVDSTFKLFGLNKTPFWKEKEITYFLSARAGLDQPIQSTSQELNSFNYGSIIYGKTPVVLDYLMDYLGEETFDKAMQFYYNQYKFTHPTFTDFFKTLSYHNGKDLSWLTEDLFLTTKKIDYKIKNVKRKPDGSYELTIKNKTGLPCPINIYGYKNKRALGLVWYDGFEGTKKFEFPSSDADYFKIDGLDRMPDINRKNNSIKTNGLFKKVKPIRLNFLTRFYDPEKNLLNFLPIIGANFYNGFMAGVLFHNYHLYQNKFDFYAAPFYAFKTKTVTGFAEINYNFLPKKNFQQITLGVKGKSFAFDQFNTNNINEKYNKNYEKLVFNYYKLSPYLKFETKKKATSKVFQTITLSSNHVFFEGLKNNSDSVTFISNPPEKKLENYYVNQVVYSYENKRVINPYNFQITSEQALNSAKIFCVVNHQFSVAKNYFFDIRVFAGTFIQNTNNAAGPFRFRINGYNGYHDYLFEDNFIARNEQQGLGFSQFSEKDGAFKVYTILGQSETWLASVNIKSPRLFILPVRLYADIATCDGQFLKKEKVLFNAGLHLPLFSDLLNIYLPLAYSKEILDYLVLADIDFWQRIRFTFNINKIVKKDIIKSTLVN
jgi:hypothetical protein